AAPGASVPAVRHRGDPAEPAGNQWEHHDGTLSGSAARVPGRGRRSADGDGDGSHARDPQPAGGHVGAAGEGRRSLSGIGGGDAGRRGADLYPEPGPRHLPGRSARGPGSEGRGGRDRAAAPGVRGLKSEGMTENQPGQEIVVFMVRRDTKCSECERELFHGSLLRMEREQPLCMDCADLGHLEYLPRGDVAVTRRASKYTRLRAVVVEWSRTRKRYERQGILAEPEAIRRAEEESLADAELRERRREQNA